MEVKVNTYYSSQIRDKTFWRVDLNDPCTTIDLVVQQNNNNNNS